MKENAKIITVAGKGGVGKTSVSAAMVKIIAEAYPDKRLLAIDADPATGLSTALGVEVRATIDDIRRSIVETLGEGDTRTAIELLGDARYKIFDAMTETDKFAFIAVGRPESAGCYCKINSYLKEVISLVSGDFDYVVIDGEAGVEQINRRVMEKVTHLILVTDPSKKGRQVIASVKEVADRLMSPEKTGVVVNRILDDEQKKYLDLGGLTAYAYIGSDPNVSRFDTEGRSLMELPDDSEIVAGARRALEAAGIL